MRYCTRCGNALGDEPVCTRCGKDNGENYGDTKINRNYEPVKKETILKNMLPGILHGITFILFAVAAVVILKNTFYDGKMRVNDIMISQGNVLFVAVYFIAGLWSTVFAVYFFLNINKRKTGEIIGASFTILFFVILGFLSSAASDHLPDKMSFLPPALGSYSGQIYQIIVPAVLSIITGIVGERKAE